MCGGRFSAWKSGIVISCLCLAAPLHVLGADLIVNGVLREITSDMMVDGEISVENGGRLRLKGQPGSPITITMVLDYDEEHHINVSDTSVLEVDNAVITASGGYQYWLELTETAQLEVKGADSWITFHSGIRPFDNAQVTVTAGDVEELQVRDNVSVTLSNAGTYPVYFFDGVTASLDGLWTDVAYTINNTVSVPGGWSFQITNGWVEGYQIDLKNDASVTLDDSDGIVLSIHTPGDLGNELQIVEGLTNSSRGAGSSSNLGSSFTFTDSNVALINVYVFGNDRVLLRDMHVNEVNAEESSELVIGQKGTTTTLNCNLCQVYDDATFTVVEATIDNSENVPSATSSYADFAAVGRGVMRFVNMDLTDLYLTLREEGTLQLHNCTWDNAKLSILDPATTVFGTASTVADFTADRLFGAAPMDVNFFDLSSGNITSRSWTFGDGGTSTAIHPAHQYTGDGPYTVGLVVTGPGASDAETKVDYINAGLIFADGFEGGSAANWTGSVP